MNVYDFDKTIYDGDSTMHFYLYCLKKHPSILKCLPKLFFAYCRYYLFGIGTKTDFKQSMYSFLKYCDIDKDVKGFWSTHKLNIRKWYLQNKQDDDLVISASPEFLLEPIADDIGFALIASKVSPKNGRYDGINCYYKEKVRRMYELYPSAVVDEFYSDSYSDKPLAELSKKAFIVKGNKLIPWDFSITKKVRM